MTRFALLSSLVLCAIASAEPPKEKGVSGVVTEVTKSSVTLDKGESFRLTADTQYFLETGRDPMVVGAGDLAKGKSVTLAVVDGVVVRVYIKRFAPLAPGEVIRLDDPLFLLAPQASGVALAEVVEVKEYDARPMDGNKGIQFKLKRVRGSGYFPDTIGVVTAFGGLRPPGSKPKPSAPLKPDSLKKGERYWIAFSSRHDYEKYNQGVIGFWPEKDKASETLEAAVKDDVFRWSPRYVPELKLSYGHVVEKDKWRVRAERDGKVLWEKTLPGKPLDAYHFGLFQSTGGDFEVQMPKCGHILFTESDARLEKDNEFGLPAGPYYVNNGFDPETGKRHGTWIRVAQGPSVEVMNRAYDLNTGKPTRDERFDFPKSGGKAVGAKTEEWWRKIERTFDVSGKVTKEEVFRYDESAEREKRWVKVKG